MSTVKFGLTGRILLLFLVVHVAINLSGCSDDDDNENRDSSSALDSEIAESAGSELEALPNENFVRQPVKSGYIRAMCLNVRDGAGTGSAVIGHLFKGDKVDVYEEGGGGKWYYVTDQAGYVDGWVSATFVSEQFVASDFIMPDSYKEPKTPTVVEGDAKYVGVKACKNCHTKPHAGFPLGPYGVWRDHYHASAFKTLARPYTLAFARKRGIDDPTSDWRCVKCHVTAYGVEASRLGKNYREEDGVGCEACHGPGSKYLVAHTNPNFSDEELRDMGFRVYTDIAARDMMCRACHNELSPTYKPFNVEAFSKAIRHWSNEYTFEGSDTDGGFIEVAAKPVPVVKPKPINLATRRIEVATSPASSSTPEPVDTEKKADRPTGGTVNDKPAARPAGGNGLEGLDKSWMLNVSGNRGVVFFPHLLHGTRYVKKENEASECQVCHHTTKAGQTPSNCSDGPCHKFESTALVSREKAFHGQCRVCHREEDTGPRKCSECHQRS